MAPRRYSLNENSPVPLYHQLKKIMRDYIIDTGLKPGDRFPSERELVNHFPVSRMTLRQALNELVNEGLLVRKRGLGTFIAPRKVVQGLVTLTSFTEDMRRRGLQPSSQLISIKTITDERIAKKLNLIEDAELLRIIRLRLADGIPMALETTHLEANRFPELKQLLKAGDSLYSILRNQYGLRLAWAEQTLEALISGEKEARLLDLEKGAPILALERITYEEGNNPVEYVESLYRADRYKFNVKLVRQGGDAGK